MEGVQATIERAVEQTAVELPLVGAHEGRMLVLAPPRERRNSNGN